MRRALAGAASSVVANLRTNFEELELARASDAHAMHTKQSELIESRATDACFHLCSVHINVRRADISRRTTQTVLTLRCCERLTLTVG